MTAQPTSSNTTTPMIDPSRSTCTINPTDIHKVDSVSSLGGGAIAGIVVRALVILGTFICILIYYRKRTHQRIQISELPPSSPAINGGSHKNLAELAGVSILELPPAADGRVWMSNEMAGTVPIAEMHVLTGNSEENLRIQDEK